MYNYGYPGCLTFMYSAKAMGLVQIKDIKKNNDYAILLKLCKKADCYLLKENLAEMCIRDRCFIDINENKVGREIQGLPVWSEDEATFRKLNEYEVQEIVFAIPSMDAEKKKTLYEYYKNAGYKLKVYDYPTVYSGSVVKT